MTVETLLETVFETQKMERQQENTNAYHIIGSEYLVKERRHPSLVRASLFNGWLIPKNELEIVDLYKGEFEIESVYDPIIEESKEVQNLLYSKALKFKDEKNKNLEIFNYSKAKNISVKKLKEDGDYGFELLYREHQEIIDSIGRIDKQIEHHRAQAKNSLEWPEPEEIKQAIPIVRKFEEGMLPSVFDDFILDISERIQCPPDYPAATIIISAATVIGAACSIRPQKYGAWEVIPNLWGGIIGPPGVKKTPAVSEAMKPISILEREADEKFKHDEAHRKAGEVVLKLERVDLESKLKSAVKKNDKKEIERIKDDLALEELNTHSTTWRRYKTNDATVPKMGVLLGENPRGLMYFRDELTGFLASLDKEGREGDRAFFLETWNGTSSTSFKCDRIERGTHSFDNLCLSIFGTIQPSKLNPYLRQTISNSLNDGLIQRFQVLVYPDALKRYVHIDRPPNYEAIKQVTDIFHKLAHTDFCEYGATINSNTKRPFFQFNEQAQDFFDKWIIALENRLLNEEEHCVLTEHFAKYRKLMPALALIFHLIDMVHTYSTGPISLTAAKKAAMWCEYLESHARRIYSIVQTHSTYSALKLLQKIKQGKLNNGFTTRDVYRHEWSGLSKSETEEACQELQEAGYLREEYQRTKPQGGATSVRYLINPKTYIKEIKLEDM